MKKRFDRQDGGLELAVRAAGSISALARGLGLSQAAVSHWRRIPGAHVLAVEARFGVARGELRPDLYPGDIALPSQCLDFPMALPLSEADKIEIVISQGMLTIRRLSR